MKDKKAAFVAQAVTLIGSFVCVIRDAVGKCIHPSLETLKKGNILEPKNKDERIIRWSQSLLTIPNVPCLSPRGLLRPDLI